MRFCLQHRAVLLQWGILDIALSLFTVEKSLRWASKVMLINSPLTRLWLAYWFSLQTSLPLQKLSCMITFLWHRQPQMQICFDWPAFEQRRSCNISHSTLYPQWHWHSFFNLLNLTLCSASVVCLCPADWRRSLSRWILPAKVSPQLWCQPRPSTRLHHLLTRQPPSSPCRKTTLPTPSDAAPGVASWREATP